jgi:hypothetical protein
MKYRITLIENVVIVVVGLNKGQFEDVHQVGGEKRQSVAVTQAAAFDQWYAFPFSSQFFIPFIIIIILFVFPFFLRLFFAYSFFHFCFLYCCRCLSQIAKYLNYTDEYDYFLKKGHDYVNLFNNETCFFHPKNNASEFIMPFDYRYVKRKKKEKEKKNI